MRFDAKDAETSEKNQDWQGRHCGREHDVAQRNVDLRSGHKRKANSSSRMVAHIYHGRWIVPTGVSD